MKIFAVLVALLCSCTYLFSQTLFTYGNNAVDKEEFLRAYNKNKTAVTDKEQVLREYLDLYTKFKLKVKAAKDMRLDTLPQILNDLQNFRGQIDESYMNNDNALNALIDEAFDHSQKDIHVIHFFIPLTPSSSTTDSVKAVAAMQFLYGELSAGKKEYDKLVDEASTNYIKVKSADIGYITAFTLPYEYEEIIYGLKPGEVNKPYHSKKGLHIFKVLDERANPGKWKVAQILFAIPPGDQAANIKMVQHRADSVYQLLRNGADFATLAKQFSDDKITYLSGGEMPEFTSGRFEPGYENEVFKLKKDGEISQPFASSFGFHIVKRLGVRTTPTDKTDATFRYDLKQKVLQDTRMASAKEAFVKSIVKQVPYKKNVLVKNADLFRFADSVVLNPAAYESKKYPISNKVIYTYGSSTVTAGEWLAFVRDYKTNPELYKGENNDALLNKFISLKSSEYYRKHLEQYNPEFRYQMEEFKDGNLLFEIMERKIWSSAANDTAGLRKYYTDHKTKYLWNASADVLIFSCSGKKSADVALAALKVGKDWKKIAEESKNTVQSDSGRYELTQINLPATISAEAGIITPITENSTDGTASFIKILKLHAANEQRTFEEAKGLVINDYQNILEEKWIAELKKKYPLKIDDKIFQSLLK
jgi:peptidyl-prolyl cis-trans isomerase SurA